MGWAGQISVTKIHNLRLIAAVFRDKRSVLNRSSLAFNQESHSPTVHYTNENGEFFALFSINENFSLLLDQILESSFGLSHILSALGLRFFNKACDFFLWSHVNPRRWGSIFATCRAWSQQVQIILAFKHLNLKNFGFQVISTRESSKMLDSFQVRDG